MVRRSRPSVYTATAPGDDRDRPDERRRDGLSSEVAAAGFPEAGVLVFPEPEETEEEAVRSGDRPAGCSRPERAEPQVGCSRPATVGHPG